MIGAREGGHRWRVAPIVPDPRCRWHFRQGFPGLALARLADGPIPEEIPGQWQIPGRAPASIRKPQSLSKEFSVPDGIFAARCRYDKHARCVHPFERTGMTANIDRREFLRLAGYGGVAFASGLGLPSCASYGSGAGSGAEDFYFVQLSDTHWGYEGPGNADPRGTLPRAIEAIIARIRLIAAGLCQQALKVR